MTTLHPISQLMHNSAMADLAEVIFSSLKTSSGEKCDSAVKGELYIANIDKRIGGITRQGCKPEQS